jgi:hypothetical protein
MPKAKGSARPGVGRRGECGASPEPHCDAPTLSDLSITKKQSSTWQKIAGLPEEHFEERIAEAKENGRLTMWLYGSDSALCAARRRRIGDSRTSRLRPRATAARASVSSVTDVLLASSKRAT